MSIGAEHHADCRAQGAAKSLTEQRAGNRTARRPTAQADRLHAVRRGGAIISSMTERGAEPVPALLRNADVNVIMRHQLFAADDRCPAYAVEMVKVRCSC